MNVNDQDFEPIGTDINIFGNLITVIVVLAIIIGLIILLVRFLGKRNQYLSQSRSIRILGAIGLGPNKTLQVIEIGESVYLVGVGENISLVDKIRDPEELAVLRQAFKEEVTELPDLSSFVNKVMQRFRKQPPVEQELDESSFKEVFQTQIQKMSDRKRQMEQLLEDKEEQSTDRLRNS